MKNLLAVPILGNNYVWILIYKKNNCIVIDPGDYNPIIKIIKKFKLKPIAILITHNHEDHINGIKKLTKKFPKLKTYGPSNSEEFGVKNILYGGEKIYFFKNKIKVLSTPGHTLNHISYYTAPYLFCGDTLFSSGCGKVYSKNYESMFNSIKLISKLPDETFLCYSHEYTICNIKFLKSIFPNNKEIEKYYYIVKKFKNENIFLVYTLKIEKMINIFLKITIFSKKKNI